MKSNFAFIGFMGTGKSTVAKLFSQQFNLKFVEIDAVIEKKAKRTIPEIFHEGEEIFRKYESEVIIESTSLSNTCISCGGGAILDKINREYLSKSSIIILLEATPSTIFQRIKEEGIKKRPLLNKEDPIKEITNLLISRQELYHEVADIIISTDDKTLEQIINEIVENLEKNDDENLVDVDLEVAFNQIKEEISQKKETNKKTINYYCKICGKKQEMKKTKFCKVCKIPVCKKCRNGQFCINCWVNFKEDPRKTIKLTQTLALFIPFITVFILLSDVIRYFITNIVIISILLLISFVARFQIIKNPTKFIELSWWQNTQTEKYQEILNPLTPERYINKELIQNYQDQKQKKIKKLKNWIEMGDQLANIPIPAHYEDKKLHKGDISEYSEAELVSTIENLDKNADRKKWEYLLIDKPCPKCQSIIKFADFCIECNERYCPKCGENSDSYSLKCICGYNFEPLPSEFMKWTNTNEVLFQKKKD
ncbi:Shikimate kinase [Candidatus Lokiarchaeum ossiferum]|uniref:Shikimate kinase n=1 Tax=Candidatus Lokiarchaeum ossiferum TaxID=2951803 RepID=A0ABY6HSX9_9ARCH|nr:Shikimate kinase [Candidatus Lokiarchaeum sp. B-35]